MKQSNTFSRKPRILCIRQVYFTKSCKQIRGCVSQPYIQTSDRMLYFTFFKTNCSQSIFRTINCKLLTKPFKKFPKSPIRPASFHFWRAPNLQWTLIELHFNIIKNLDSTFIFFYLFKGFITMCTPKKPLIRAAFWVNSCKRSSGNHWKQTAQRWRLLDH